MAFKKSRGRFSLPLAPFALILPMLFAFVACTSVTHLAKDFAKKMAPTPHIEPQAAAQPMKPGIRRMFESVQGKIQFPHGVVSIYGMSPVSFKKLKPKLRETHLTVEKALLLMPEENKIVIIGHSDPIGGPGAALRYGHARARSVRNYLVRRGIAANRLVTMSAGASELIDKKNMHAPENHRITFTVEAPEPDPAKTPETDKQVADTSTDSEK